MLKLQPKHFTLFLKLESRMRSLDAAIKYMERENQNKNNPKFIITPKIRDLKDELELTHNQLVISQIIRNEPINKNLFNDAYFKRVRAYIKPHLNNTDWLKCYGLWLKRTPKELSTQITNLLSDMQENTRNQTRSDLIYRASREGDRAQLLNW